MLVRRLLALVVAVGLVAGAWFVRNRVIEGGGNSGGGGGDAPAAVEDVRVACVRELEDVCERLGAAEPPLVEDASATVARFAEAELPFDVWLTLEPWPVLGASTRERAGHGPLEEARSQVVARSPVMLAAHADRLPPMEETCGGAVTWACLGEHADQPWSDLGGQSTWGRVKVGFDDPATRASGLLALTQATASYFDGSQFNTRSLTAPDYFSWVSNLAAAAGSAPSQSPFERMLLTGAAEYEFTGVLESVAVPLLQRAGSRADQIVLRRAEPVITADVVVVGYGPEAQRAVETVAEQVTGPLTESGWRVPGADPLPQLEGAGLPTGSGLPSAATIEALQQTWQDVAR